MRKTKIICTLGPATDAVLTDMIKAGMNVARMNFSHGSYEEHKARMDAVKAARKELGMPVGIMLDTKNFILKTGVRTFEASAYLKRRGADTVEVKKMFENSLDTYKERSQLVAGAEIYKGCAIACSNWEFPNVRIAAAQAADELLSIQGVRASFVIFRVGNEIAISARSLGDVNVQILLEEFGGGGHLNMAGAQVKNSTTNDVRKALIRVLDEKLSEATKKNN